ncbi:hypothetical protein ACM16X_02620 [Haloarcula japonica]|uniref:hypothetical protein n=1 Tax=Haloarcula japonica TaxID=29282 RepID=UPI0039F64F87
MSRDDGFDMVFTEEHEDQVRNKHGEQVLKSLKKKLDRKRREVSWKKNKHELRRRLHKIVAGDDFAEMSFKAKRRQYRAVFVILEDEQVLVFVSAVEKQDESAYEHSPQHDLLDGLEKNRKDWRDYGRRILEEQRD